jgi:exodeoxyribonuclease VII large subunit
MDLPDDAPGLLAKVAAGDNSPAMSVGELSGALKRTVEETFSRVRVRGEISGWKRHGSGHCYFTLKDEEACIDAVLWRGQAARLAFVPEDGAEVIATGKLSTYPGRSKYQIVVDQLELAGEGALMALLDRRRRALADEGLFDRDRKRPLPFLPARIGVVTSPTGAVIRDILHRLADRCPSHVLLWPVPVQGEGAADKVAAAIRGFGRLSPPIDLLIVARGGGSIEDLWAFNEEAVVRAVADCRIPVISAVGHETDTTLIDFVADQRAPTPTAAAEMAVPVLADLEGTLDRLGERSSLALDRLSARARERLAAIAQRLPDPRRLFDSTTVRVAEFAGRLPRALGARASESRGRLGATAARFRPALIGVRIERFGDRLAALARMAELAHPERPLKRGFARITDSTGATLASAESARHARSFTLRFADGSVDAAIAGSGGKVERKAPPTYPRPTPARQPGLFDDAGE